MLYAIDCHGLSKRAACRLVGLASSTAHYRAKRTRSEEPVREAIAKVIEMKSHAGLPRVVEALRDKMGFPDNHKRIGRIYRLMGLQVSRRKHKRRMRPRLAMATPSRPNEQWAMDFVLDSFACGRRFRCLTVKDLFTHEVVAIAVDRSIGGDGVARALDRAAQGRGYPAEIVCDNGTEFTSIAMDRWSSGVGTKLRFIQPGKPVQNAFIESFNAILRNECLNRYWFTDLEEARRIIEEWRVEYNTQRTQKRLGKITPVEFAKRYQEQETVRSRVVQ